MLYRTEHGIACPRVLKQLINSEVPAARTLATGLLVCPDDGRYLLSDDGTVGLCSVHGRSRPVDALLRDLRPAHNGDRANPLPTVSWKSTISIGGLSLIPLASACSSLPSATASRRSSCR